MTTDDYKVLEAIGNMTPADLRELVYVGAPTGYRRDMVKRHYQTRGALICRVFELYMEGSISIPVPS